MTCNTLFLPIDSNPETLTGSAARTFSNHSIGLDGLTRFFEYAAQLRLRKYLALNRGNFDRIVPDEAGLILGLES